ncbi:MAG: cyclohexadienyl dehydrogenase [Pelagibacteraceae bacterium]|nr:cyclohexadienyl dehydrogenase [Pelagibacteraceae bacterium]|tara:strand:+ start:12905 stop:13819 length:915 start_codon:yes stop_codon:yes gene_type:complete
MVNKKIESVLIVGMGLIGSSISRALIELNITNNIFGLDSNEHIIKKCNELNLLIEGDTNINKFNQQFDLIIICTPLNTYKKIFTDLNKYISQPTLITDVGSTKVSVIQDFKECINNNYLKFLPAHPIAGIEKSGPEYGFAKLFENRYCIVTPLSNDENTIRQISYFWESIGMIVEKMDPNKHDRVLAMTSHIPQLIAYSVVATATELESHLKDEVIKYSAAGFRDFTRLAGSDPIMWRDIYNKNKDAVLEMLGRFSEDLSTFQKAIRNNDLDFLQNKFSNSKEIRKIIEDLGQAGSFDPTENKN